MVRLLIRYFHLNGGGCFHFNGRIDADKGLTPAVSTFAEPLIRRLTPQQFRLYTPITVLQREPALQLHI